MVNNNEIRKGDNNMIEIFKNEEFGEIRMVMVNNEPYFVGKDVASILGYAKTRNAIARHVDEEDKKDAPIRGDLGGTQKMTVINESGLYSLILSSKLPTAKKFKRWVTNDILPSIRKHGAYMTEETIEKAITNPDFLIRLATELKHEKEQRKLLEEEKKINAPKVVFADAVSVSTESISIGTLAKLLKQNGIEVGRTRLFEWLRENKYLMKGSDKNMPTQRSMEQGLFEVKEGVRFNNPNGMPEPTFTTMVTGKGQQYFINRILKAFEK